MTLFGQNHAEQKDRWLEEIYSGCPEYQTDDLRKINQEILDRYVWLHDPHLDPLLVTHHLKDFDIQNKCNADLDHNFEQSTFETAINPLKFLLPFYSDRDLVIQVNRSHYYMIILRR